MKQRDFENAGEGQAGRETSTLPPGTERDWALGISCILLVVLGIALVVDFTLAGSVETPRNQWSVYQSARALWDLHVLLLLAITCTVSVLFSGIATRARKEDRGVAIGATIVVTIGVLIISLSYALLVWALNGIASAGPAPVASDPIYQAAIWYTIQSQLEVSGDFVLGVGLFVFAILIARSPAFAKWLAVISGASGTGMLASYWISPSLGLALALLLATGAAFHAFRGFPKPDGHALGQ